MSQKYAQSIALNLCQIAEKKKKHSILLEPNNQGNAENLT